jgi:hypothetical protein
MMRTSTALVLVLVSVTREVAVVWAVALVVWVAMGCMLAHTPPSLGTFRKGLEYKSMMRTSTV